jgi:hypothetical protein
MRKSTVRCNRHRSPDGIPSFSHQRKTSASPTSHVAGKQLEVSVADETEEGPGQMSSRAVFAGQYDQACFPGKAPTQRIS